MVIKCNENKINPLEDYLEVSEEFDLDFRNMWQYLDLKMRKRRNQSVIRVKSRNHRDPNLKGTKRISTSFDSQSLDEHDKLHCPD